MTCRIDKKLLYAYVDNSIEDLEKIFVEEHLKYCEECNREFKIIRLIENGLEGIEKDAAVPERLSKLSELIAENCIAAVEETNLRLKVHNYFEDMKNLRKSIAESQKLRYENPYDKFIKKSTQITAEAIGKPIRDYYKKKMAAISLFKLLKVG